jgi:cell wall-associated NlpC family hydrolase
MIGILSDACYIKQYIKFKKGKQMFLIRYIGLFLVFACSYCYANNDNLISLFPIEHYSQDITDWIHPNDNQYNLPLLNPEMQKRHINSFYQHYFGLFSPWNTEYIHAILRQSSGSYLISLEKSIISDFTNQNKAPDEIGYGENFRPHSQNWIDHITQNMDLSQFETLSYQPDHRAIAIQNLNARSLPTDDVSFYHYTYAGEGYPFDNLQMSALWVGTPVYILGQTRDRAWLLVMTPEYIAWVKSWSSAAKKNLAAITHTQTSIIDHTGQFRFSAYIGAVFPAKKIADKINIMIPIANTHQQAIIQHANLSTQYATMMPLTPTPHHMATLMDALIGRPYGWGNMYFYNDCSAELKNLFTPFGIWLPRHSANQISAGKIVDISSQSPEERLHYLQTNGHPFMTIIYLGGHVILYIGNYPDPHDDQHTMMAMTYQNIWGLRPHPSTRRAVIGKSVLLPMLLSYPEDRSLKSLANDPYFQLSYLDQVPNYIEQLEKINLKDLVYPKK